MLIFSETNKIPHRKDYIKVVIKYKTRVQRFIKHLPRMLDENNRRMLGFV